MLECFRFGSAVDCDDVFDFFLLSLIEFLNVSSIEHKTRKKMSLIASMSLAAEISKYDAFIDFAKLKASFLFICRLWLKSVLFAIIVNDASLPFRFFNHCDKLTMYSKLLRLITENTRIIDSAHMHKSSFCRENDTKINNLIYLHIF